MHCTLEVFFKFCSPALHFIFVWGLSGDDLGERAEMGGRGGEEAVCFGGVSSKVCE